MVRNFQKRCLFLFVMALLLSLTTTFAQQIPPQIFQGIPGGTFGQSLGALRPSFPQAGTRTPVRLSAAEARQVERVCKFEDLDEMLEGSPSASRSSSEGSSQVTPPLNALALQNRLDSNESVRANRSPASNESAELTSRSRVQLYRPSVFERYVKAVTGKEVCRFGFQAAFGSADLFAPSDTASAPDDYVLGPGDEVLLRVWGSFELEQALIIDRSGLVYLSKFGPVKLAGTRLGQAANIVKSALRKQYSGFDVSVTAGELRGIKVYLTGFADRPGALNVSNFSSLSSVVFAAGGPSSAGSFRNIELRRKGEVIARLDLYDLLMRGDKRSDRMLVSEDVIHFAPIGPQVAVVGGVNAPAVFELRAGETATDVIRMAGLYSPGAKRDSAYRLAIQRREEGFISHSSTSLEKLQLSDGDILSIPDLTALQFPKQRMMKRVVIQGNVQKPGEYLLPPDATLKSAVQTAGGLTDEAFLYGLRLQRREIFEREKVTLKRVLRNFERDYIAQGTVRPIDQSDAAMLTARLEFGQRLLSRLQIFEPEGRLVLDLTPESKEVPEIPLEDNDVIFVPSLPRTISVFGSVTSPGSYAFVSNGSAAQYLALAGGLSKGADPSEAFVIRANGQTKKGIPGLTAWRGWSQSKQTVELTPGDVIVIPEDMNKVSYSRQLVQWSQILYQLGLGVAAIKVLQQ